MLKKFSLTLVLIAFGAMALADEQTVVISTDNKPFAVKKSDLVRLSAQGISGSKIDIKVEGPAKVEATSILRKLVNGKPLIGNTAKEFDLKPTDKGNVTVTITVTPPQPGAEAKVTKIEFEVK